MISELQIALQLLQENKMEEAIQLIEELSKKANDDELYTIGELYFDWGFLDEATEVFNQLIDKYPSDSQLKIALSSIKIEQEKDNEAIDLLSSINQADEFYLHALIQLADLYQVQGLYEVAENKLKEAKQLEPNEFIIDFALAELYFSTGRYKVSLSYYERVLESADDINGVDVNERVAEALALVGEYESALAYYEQIKGKSNDVLFKYGFTASQVNKPELAIKVWEELLTKDDNYHSVYPELIKMYLKVNNLTEAEKTLEKALLYDEYNKELYFLSGEIKQAQGKFDEAKVHYRKSLSIDFDYKEALMRLVQLLKAEEDYEEIILTLEKSKADGAVDVEYDLELAQAHYELENFEEVAKIYEALTVVLKDDPDYLKTYGYFLLEEGKQVEALSKFNAYLKIIPLDQDVLSLVERLEMKE